MAGDKTQMVLALSFVLPMIVIVVNVQQENACMAGYLDNSVARAVACASVITRLLMIICLTCVSDSVNLGTSERICLLILLEQ